METLLSSFALVAASEMGDKTQLLAFSLAARFKRPLPILAGILVATLLNHALAASVGSYISGLVSPQVLKVVLALTFFAFAIWTLKPDTLDAEPKESRWGPFLTTAVLFFLAEMGDKTQLATVALGARFASALWVTLGTTLGMMASDGLAVFVGHRMAERLPMKWIRRAAALLFLIFGLLLLISKPVSALPSQQSVDPAPVTTSAGGLWVGERENPRAFVLLGHGLNLKPSKMRPLAEQVCNRDTQYACRILELPGHEEQTASTMGQVTAEGWKRTMLAEVDQVFRLARERQVPIFYIGYSLGGLMGEWVQSVSESSPFTKVVLIAPALAAHFYVHWLAYLPFTDGAMIPSRNHESYRLNRSTSLGAYRSMFSIMSEVWTAAGNRLDRPTLVVVNPNDELVSDRKLRNWAESRALSTWEFMEAPELKPSIQPVYQHLMIDLPSMGSESWEAVSRRIRDFLR